MKNTFGSDLSLTIFGESHGRAVGAVLDGMAAGVPVDESFLAACMDKRRARGNGLSTPRVEADAVQLLSGVVNGHTTGTAIALMIENQNTRSGDYAKTADLLRPGHADFTAYAKYHGFQDARGGGHFSGRVLPLWWQAAASCLPHCSGRALISPPTSPGAQGLPIPPLRWTTPPPLRHRWGRLPPRPRALRCWTPPWKSP